MFMWSFRLPQATRADSQSSLLDLGAPDAASAAEAAVPGGRNSAPGLVQIKKEPLKRLPGKPVACNYGLLPIIVGPIVRV